MQIESSSPGVLGPQCGQRPVGPDVPRRRTARDARGLCAGAGGKGPAEKLRAGSWKGPPKAAQLNSYIVTN
jgi:hypothetical protein